MKGIKKAGIFIILISIILAALYLIRTQTKLFGIMFKKESSDMNKATDTDLIYLDKNVKNNELFNVKITFQDLEPIAEKFYGSDDYGNIENVMKQFIDQVSSNNKEKEYAPYNISESEVYMKLNKKEFYYCMKYENIKMIEVVSGSSADGEYVLEEKWDKVYEKTKEQDEIEFKIITQKEEYVRGERIKLKVYVKNKAEKNYNLIAGYPIEGKYKKCVAIIPNVIDQNKKLITTNQTNSVAQTAIFKDQFYDQETIQMGLEIHAEEIKEGDCNVNFELKLYDGPNDAYDKPYKMIKAFFIIPILKE